MLVVLGGGWLVVGKFRILYLWVFYVTLF